MTGLILACGSYAGLGYALLLLFAGLAGACLLLGLVSAGVTAAVVGRRSALWLTPVYAVAWGTVSVVGLALGGGF